MPGLENPEDLPKVEEKNFRYPGPRPKTKESGIICLADTVESASRTLTQADSGENHVLWWMSLSARRSLMVSWIRLSADSG